MNFQSSSSSLHRQASHMSVFALHASRSDSHKDEVSTMRRTAYCLWALCIFKRIHTIRLGQLPNFWSTRGCFHAERNRGRSWTDGNGEHCALVSIYLSFKSRMAVMFSPGGKSYFSKLLISISSTPNRKRTLSSQQPSLTSYSPRNTPGPAGVMTLSKLVNSVG